MKELAENKKVDEIDADRNIIKKMKQWTVLFTTAIELVSAFYKLVLTFIKPFLFIFVFILSSK